MQLDSTAYHNKLTYFPSQKEPAVKKTEDWGIKCIESAINLILLNNEGIRELHKNKVVNYDLANDVLDESEIHKMFNPMDFKSGTFPAKILNYNISMSKVNTLVGLELRRKFDSRAVCTSEVAQADKQQFILDKLYNLAEEIISKGYSEDVAKEKLQALNRETKLYRHVREKWANVILLNLWYKLRLKELFNKCFKDLLLVAEEIVRTDVVNGEVVCVKCDPLKVFTSRNGLSPFIEDSEIIIETSYAPLGKIIDEFHDVLTPQEVEYLESGFKSNMGSHNLLHARAYTPVINTNLYLEEQVTNSLIEIEGNNLVTPLGGWFNRVGEVRIVRVRWLSRVKRVGVTYFDELGEKQYKLRSEYYKVDKAKGETGEEVWINEWWEGTKLADNIYVNVKPRQVQFRNMSNPSKCSSGYVGIIQNINSNRAMSLMDRMKPFQYLYNVFMRRLELAFATMPTPVLQINNTLMPDGWTPEKWMYYAKVMGMLFVDPFNEGQEGAATGKLAGSQNTITNQFLNPQLGNYIQLHVEALQYIEVMVGKISGVNDAMEGQQNYQESVGGTNNKINQGTAQVEETYATHELFKKRVLENLLECAKYAYKGNKNKTVPYILDDEGVALMNVDTEQFNESEYDIHISDYSRDGRIHDILEGQAQAIVQNGGSISTLISILKDTSIASIQRTLQEDEANRQQQAADTQKQQLQSAQQIAQMQLQTQQLEAEKDRNLKREEMEMQMNIALLQNEAAGVDTGDSELKAQELKLKELKARVEADLAKNKIEHDKSKLSLEQQRIEMDKQHHAKEMELKHKIANKPNKSK